MLNGLKNSHYNLLGLWRHRVVRKSSGGNIVWVRVPPRAPIYRGMMQW